VTQDIAVPRTQPLNFDLEMRGEEPQLLTTLDGLAVLLTLRKDTGELVPKSVWRWNNFMPNDPLVRIDGVWFAPREITPF
jgi:hypothetical protein